MSQTEFTASKLRNLKEQKKREALDKCIHTFTYHFSKEVLKHAENSDTHLFASNVKNISSFYNEKFLIENKDEIIKKLKKYFPDSIIETRIFTRSVNNTMVDISKLDENALELFDSKLHETFLVVDYNEH